MQSSSILISNAGHLPFWRRPFTLLALMAFCMPMAFSTWMALLNNFVVHEAGFNGRDIGWLQSIREVPGFFAVGVIIVILFIREQLLAIISMMLLGAVIAVTAWFPTFYGLLITTFLSSLGFHYYETVKMSLELQWLSKEEAPQKLGWLISIGSAASLITYLFIMFTWKTLGWDYNTLYMIGGGVTFVVAIYCWAAFPRFEGDVIQHKNMVLRKRYWLYYALQFMAGARRQIFIVFAAFMMVERFGFEVHEVTGLFLATYFVNIFIAPIMGRMVSKFGERNALAFEYVGLVAVFLAYAGIYVFGWSVVVAAGLYLLDHFFFALALAQKTYFQKIADPKDIAPTAAVAFTINHIGAVVLPALLGYVWLVSPTAVFGIAAAMAGVSLGLALLIPRHPMMGRETIFAKQG
ncbi:MFS transporter [Amylibacter sp. SFDW26]|uniref:MFS transporter n=1 Tax=Amylibacter sp. SFDW26 TaxID=2652722 RepID=UPI00126198EE|nr:MFS transporter [Amylibacter sp. SFDW26]KAB7613447.1 MFS transporter [Amylibacter sp. SFDW26]